MRDIRDYAKITGMSTPIGTDTAAWIPSTKSFGARLALIRWRMGWNIKEAAEACGLKESNWRGWELDGRLPHQLNDVAVKIAITTGVSKYWLIDGEGQPSDYTPSRFGLGVIPKARPRSRADSRRPGDTTSRRQHQRRNGWGRDYARSGR